MRKERLGWNNQPARGKQSFLQRRNNDILGESTSSESSVSIADRQGNLERSSSPDDVASVREPTDDTMDTTTMPMTGASAKLTAKCCCRNSYDHSRTPIRDPRPTETTSMTRHDCFYRPMHSIVSKKHSYNDNHAEEHQDSLKSQVHTLVQEIANISRDIKKKKKQYSLISHRARVDQCTDDSRETRGRLSSNNIRTILNELEIKVDSKEDSDGHVVEGIDPAVRKEYLGLTEKRKELQRKINKEQLEIDVIMAVKAELEKQIELSSTQMAGDREKSQGTGHNCRWECKSDEEEQNSGINADKQTPGEPIDARTRVKPFEVDSEEEQFELVITDEALINEINERIAVFENKLAEMMEAHRDLVSFIQMNRKQVGLSQLESNTVESIHTNNGLS